MVLSQQDYVDSTFPADTDLEEWIPEIITDTLGDLMSAAMLAMYNVEQVHTDMKTYQRGLYQQGQQSVVSQFAPLTITSAKRFIRKSRYNPVKDLCFVDYADFMQLPRRGQLTPQQNQQYIDAEVKRQTWTDRDPAAYDIIKTDLDDDTSWHEVDISSIVGAKQMIVQLGVLGQDNLVNSYIRVRNGGNINQIARAEIRTQVANIYTPMIPFTVQTTSAGKIGVLVNPKPTDWVGIFIVIWGYKPA